VDRESHRIWLRILAQIGLRVDRPRFGPPDRG
jgi:hypothetical protein